MAVLRFMAAHALLLKALGFGRMDLMPMDQQVDFVWGLLVIFVLAQSEVTTNQVEAGETLALASVFG